MCEPRIDSSNVWSASDVYLEQCEQEGRINHRHPPRPSAVRILKCSNYNVSSSSHNNNVAVPTTSTPILALLRSRRLYIQLPPPSSKNDVVAPLGSLIELKEAANVHSDMITSICFNCSGTVLVSCSRDAIVFWHISHVSSKASIIPRSLPLSISSSWSSNDDADIMSVSFDRFDRARLVLVFTNGDIAVFDTDNGREMARFEAVGCHLACSAEYVPPSSAAVLCSASLLSVCWNPDSTQPLAVIASSESQLMIVRYSPVKKKHRPHFSLISTLDLDTMLMSSTTTEDDDEAASVEGGDSEEEDHVHTSLGIVAVDWISSPSPLSSSSFGSSTLVVIATTRGIVVLSGESFDVLEQVCFPESSLHVLSSFGIPSAASFALAGAEIRCVLSGAFSSRVINVHLNYESVLQRSDTHLSLYSSTVLPVSSPLRKSKFTSSAASSSSSSKPASSSSSLNKPITFHSRIKSSGYGSKPPSKMFTPAFKKPNSKNKNNSSSSKRRAYPKECSLICALQEKYLVSDKSGSTLIGRLPQLHNGPVLRLGYANDAQTLLSCSTDSTSRISRLPFSKFKGGEGSALTGHKAAVRSARFSSDSNMIVSASADRSVAVYRLPRTEPVLSIATQVSHKSSSDSAKNPPFSGEATEAAFFYQDRFIALCCRSQMGLYKYVLGDDKSGDLNRPFQNFKYARVARYTEPGVNSSFTSFTCLNSLNSHLVIAATRNRAMKVLDMSVGATVVRNNERCHDRPIHSLVLCTNSKNSECFFSASTDGTVKLWDMRSRTCIRRFEGHLNRQKAVGLDASPCGRYIAVGSEDNMGYMYEIGSGKVLTRLRGHRDAISAIAFNPVHPQLAMAAYDGTVAFFSSS